MPKATKYDGTTVEWTGLKICFCMKCREIFNSVSAFDAHIRHGVHDFSWMPVNNKGYRVTELKEPEN